MAKKTFLDFETPIAELENKIEELRYVQTESAVDISAEINQLAKKSQQLTKDIYSDLTPWQITKIARHAERPYTMDYVNELFTHFVELHGDRHFADDLSIVGGLARFNGTPCMVIGQQKGRDTRERATRNFGMSKPEGYRKALRLMKTAEKFKLPVFTFVDTPVPTLALMPKSVASPRPLAAIFLRWRSSKCRSSPPSLVKAAPAAHWRFRWVTSC